MPPALFGPFESSSGRSNRLIRKIRTFCQVRTQRIPLILLVLLLLPTGCRKASPTTVPAPTQMAMEALEAPTSDGAPAAPDAPPSPVATWTSPAPNSGPRRVGPKAPATQVAAPASTLDAALGDFRPTEPAPYDPANAPAPPASGPGPDPMIVEMMRQVSAPRLLRNADALVGMGTRHAFSDTESDTTGIGAARRWLFSEFEDLSKKTASPMRVSFDDFELKYEGTRSDQRNVAATLAGDGGWKRILYLVAHYDSRNADPKDGAGAAPGADDNASGTAVLLEVARIMRQQRWPGTLRFVATAGEELDLAGARHHAEAAKQGALPILAVLNNDVLGGAPSADGARESNAIRIYSVEPEGGASRRLARYLRFIGERYQAATGLETRLVARADREGRAGDHIAFSLAGFPAARFISASEDESRQHTDQDTLEQLDADYMAKAARLELAVAANLALAPPAPWDPPQLALDDAGTLSLRWATVDDPAVAGYYVALRGLDGPDEGYTDLRWVAGATNTELRIAGLSPPRGYAIAIASADAQGHPSLFGPEARVE